MPLHLAMDFDVNPGVAELLLRKGARVNVKNEEGLTPLNLLWIGHVSAAPDEELQKTKALVSKGAVIRNYSTIRRSIEEYEKWSRELYANESSHYHEEALKLAKELRELIAKAREKRLGLE
ncbi:hypothetical protein HY095_02505 [Candidatus Micrarchaeota archaeon]|nr:hypothetical protein [Candidatus Micrarchaeota archaeon]